MYKKGAGNDKQGKDAGNRTLCQYRNFSQVINSKYDPRIQLINSNFYMATHPALLSRNVTILSSCKIVPSCMMVSAAKKKLKTHV